MEQGEILRWGHSGPRHRWQMLDKCAPRHFPPHTRRKFNSSLFPHFHFSTLKIYCSPPHAAQREDLPHKLDCMLPGCLTSSAPLCSPLLPLTAVHLAVQLLSFDLTPVFPVVEILRALAPPAHCLCGETGARLSLLVLTNFTGRRRSGTGLAPPHLLRSLFAREWPRSQHWLAAAASPGPTRACVGG